MYSSEKFITYFPKETWPKSSFKIEYYINNSFIVIERVGSKGLSFFYSDDFKRITVKGRKFYKDEQKKIKENSRISVLDINRNAQKKFYDLVKTEISEISIYSQFFVPAGRSFFANIQSSIFSFLSNNKSLDPFLIEFGSFYQNFKMFILDQEAFGDIKNDKENFERLIFEIMNGSFLREKEKDFIVHPDKRKVNLSNASSGQQETLPLLVVLKILNILNMSGSTLYIEEPEAHLFPNAQKKIVQLLARTFNNYEKKCQIIVTTHSPYILSSFNNLLEAGKIIEDKPKNIKKVNKIVSSEELLFPKDLIAYSILNGKNTILINEEHKLISQNILDSVSDEISKEFGQLLDIEFED